MILFLMLLFGKIQMIMEQPKQVLAISGSIVPDSTNMQILRLCAEWAGPAMQFEFYNQLDKLPFFNPVPDAKPPAEVSEFLEKIAAADAVLICTPEYVFSLPGILKNALEWTVSSIVFSEKPVALITAASIGAKAHESLLLIMNTLGVKIVPDGALHIPGARSKMKNGEVIDVGTEASLRALVRGMEKTLIKGALVD